MLRRNYFLYETDSGSGSGGGTEDESGSTDDSGAQGGDAGQGSGQGGEESVPRSELQKANAESARRKRELREAQQRIAELEGQSKTDLEREKDRVKKLEADLTSANTKNRNLRVEVLAGRVGIVQEARSDAARLLDWETVKDPDDDSSIEEALRELVKDKKFLLGNVPGGADGGAGGDRDADTGDMNARLRAAAGR